jgi:hypothetical protein
VTKNIRQKKWRIKMKPNAVMVFEHENDILFRLVEHQGEDIKNFYMGASHKTISDSEAWIAETNYQKGGKIYSTICFGGGVFKNLPRYNNVAWATYLNYRILFEFIDNRKIKISFFHD